MKNDDHINQSRLKMIFNNGSKLDVGLKNYLLLELVDDLLSHKHKGVINISSDLGLMYQIRIYKK